MGNFSLIDAFAGIASRNAEREAIATLDARYTFADLLRIASKCASHFSAQGVLPGDRVAVALPRPEDTIFAVLATWMVGATCIVIDFRTKWPEKAVLAESFGIRAMVEPRSSPEKQDYLSVPTGESLAETVASEADGIYIRPAEVHPAIIIRTSGTTGTPVGVVFNHETVMRLHWTMGQYYLGFDRGLLVHALPLFYAAGIVRTISHLLDGSPTHILPSISSAEEIAEKLLVSKARNIAVVPPHMLGLLELSEGRDTPMFPDLDVITGSGGKFPADIVVRAYQELSNNLRITYGASFGGSISFLAGPDILRMPDSVGRPLPHNHVRITDFDGNPVKQGESGLICVRGPTIADGIVGEARALSDKVIDGWAVPGDLGYLNEEGFLTLSGRASDMIIRKGVNVFPREIEAVLERLDGVVEVAAVGYRDMEAGEEIAAFVVTKPGVKSEILTDYVKANIVADKRPRAIHIVDTLPRNDAGKVVKSLLVDKIEAEQN